MKRLSLREVKNANARALRGLMLLSGKAIPEGDPLFVEEHAPARKPKATPTLPTEHQEQVAFVRWFRARFPTVKIFAIPNAAVRDERLAAWMKAEGLTAGVPDLCIPSWNLWIEMKRRIGGKVSPDQAEWIAYLNLHGHRAIVCKGCDDAILQVNEFLKVNGAALAGATKGSSRSSSAPPIFREKGDKMCATTRSV